VIGGLPGARSSALQHAAPARLPEVFCPAQADRSSLPFATAARALSRAGGGISVFNALWLQTRIFLIRPMQLEAFDDVIALQLEQINFENIHLKV